MRFILTVLLSITFSFSASAQWWRVSPVFKKHIRLPQLEIPCDYSIEKLPLPTTVLTKIPPIDLKKGDYSLELAEAAMIKTAQHNMRFRIYDVASYNFSELARLYIQQNRFSEAKWYLLQSNNISRQQNDDKHTIANLMDLALVKASISETLLAQEDLAEAMQLAKAKGWRDDMEAISKEAQFINLNKDTAKSTLRYADATYLVVPYKKPVAADKKAD